MIVTSPGRIPVKRWSSTIAQTWRATCGRMPPGDVGAPGAD